MEFDQSLGEKYGDTQEGDGINLINLPKDQVKSILSKTKKPFDMTFLRLDHATMYSVEFSKAKGSLGLKFTDPKEDDEVIQVKEMKKGSQADATGLIKIGDHLVLVGEHDVLDYGRDEMIELIKNDLNTFGSVRLCFHSATSGGNQHGMGGEPGQTDEIQIKINKKELLKSSKTYDNVTKRNSIEFDDYINILQVLDKRFDSKLKETIVFAMYDVDGDGRIGVDDLV